MEVLLQYGQDGLKIDIPSDLVHIIEPKFMEGLQDEKAEFFTAVENPIQSSPLKEKIEATDKVAVVIPDITRPLPSDRLLPWLFEMLSHVPKENITIINGTGSHRINTPDELIQMVGKDIVDQYKIVNHSAHHPEDLKPAGKTADGRTIHMNKDYVEADKRIVLGFIEPHFMAGFSGGYKGVFPAVADIDSIMHYHRAEVIGSPNSTWGALENNPTQEQVRQNGSVLPVDFLINVTLNQKKEITKYFCGDVMAAHEAGCAFAKETAMAACSKRFPIVITTNSGYPLDQNLYQTVKGMHAAMQIVEKDGLIITAARCNDGFPDHGNYKKLLFDHDSPQALLNTILAPGFSMYDQWEAQLHAIVCLHAKTALYSEISADEVRKAHLDPIADINDYIQEAVSKIGAEAAIAVLPEGPMTIPYIST